MQVRCDVKDEAGLCLIRSTGNGKAIDARNTLPPALPTPFTLMCALTDARAFRVAGLEPLASDAELSVVGPPPAVQPPVRRHGGRVHAPAAHGRGEQGAQSALHAASIQGRSVSQASIKMCGVYKAVSVGAIGRIHHGKGQVLRWARYLPLRHSNKVHNTWVSATDLC